MPKFESLSIRVLVALIAIPIILWLTMLGGYFFFFLIAIISSLTLFEFYGLAEAKGAAPLKTLGLIGGVIINAVFVYKGFRLISTNSLLRILTFIFRCSHSISFLRLFC